MPQILLVVFMKGISKKIIIDGINECKRRDEVMMDMVKFVFEQKNDWNDSFYREYWLYVREFIDNYYGNELTEDEKDELYNKVMEYGKYL